MQRATRRKPKKVRWALLLTLLLVLLVGGDFLWAQIRAQRGAREAKGFNAAALRDVRKRFPYRSLNNPVFVPPAEADFLGDEDYVLGVVVEGQARAYPTRLVSWHHAVNDQVADTPFAVTYCSVCNTGICFDRRVDGRRLTMEFLGLYQGASALTDRETWTVWGQLSGEALKGELAGKTMTQMPLLDTTWRMWKKLHPDTMVMAPHPSAGYLPRSAKVPRWYSGFPEREFAASLLDLDERLPPFEPVLGVAVQAADPPEGAETRRAYTLRQIRAASGVINDTLGGRPIAVLMDRQSETVIAVERILNGRTLTLQPRAGSGGVAEFSDAETGTSWNIEGVATRGELVGARLPRVTAHLSQWYGWAAYYPETTIYDRGSVLGGAENPSLAKGKRKQ